MKCIVKNCENYEHQGRFHGQLCAPCYEFASHGSGTHSQLYRNTALRERVACEIIEYQLLVSPADFVSPSEHQAYIKAVHNYAQEIKARSNNGNNT